MVLSSWGLGSPRQVAHSTLSQSAGQESCVYALQADRWTSEYCKEGNRDPPSSRKRVASPTLQVIDFAQFARSPVYMYMYHVSTTECPRLYGAGLSGQRPQAINLQNSSLNERPWLRVSCWDGHNTLDVRFGVESPTFSVIEPTWCLASCPPCLDRSVPERLEHPVDYHQARWQH